MLGWVGIDGPAWLDSTTLALPSLVVMAAWRNFGTLMVIFLAGLQTIPKEMNEAAEVDGATGWGRFRYITLPMLRPVLLFGAVITGIGYLQFFEEAFVMTKGGPLDSTRSVTYFTYDQFGFGNFGYAAAASYLLFLAVVLLTFVQFRLLGERDDKVSKKKAKKAERATEGGAVMSSRTADRDTMPATDRRLRARSRPRSGGGDDIGKAPGWIYVRARRRSVPRRRAVHVDAALVVQARARGPRRAADLVAGDDHAGELRPAVHPARLPDVLHELASIVALAVTVGNMVFCSMLGYALAKLDFPGKKALFVVVLGTLMVPGVVTFVPLFVLTTKMGLTNTSRA